MSIKNTARDIGAIRDPSVKIPDGESINVLIDAGQDPEHVPLHNLGTYKKRCTAGPDGVDPCKLCAAEVPVRHNWTVKADQIDPDGVAHPRTIWLSRQDLGRLAEVLPDSGSCELWIDRVKDENAKTKRNDGTDWTVYRFSTEKQ